MSNIKIVKYFGDSCAPCKAMAPVFDKVKTELEEDGFAFVSRDIGEGDYATEARSFGVRGIPSFVVFKDSRPLGFKSGMMSEDSLRNFILDTVRGSDNAA